jgi:polysaccharide pyruvyl transferase WcaK-like protein
MTGRVGRPLNVWLYTAIPEHDEFRPHGWSPFQRTKSIVRNAADRLLTVLNGQLPLDTFHYQVANNLGDNSNRGDIAVRIAVREQIADAVGERPINFFELKWASLTHEIVDEINCSCDLFVICGGGYLFINSDGSGGGSFADIPQLQKIFCPIVAYGIGLNRLMHERVRDVRDIPAKTQGEVREFVAACSQIGVRDAHTLELLDLYGDKPISLIGDPVLFLQSSQVSSSNKEHGSRPSIGVNLAVHSWRALKMLKSVLPGVIELLKHMQSSHNATLTYLVHHDYEDVVVSLLRQQGIQMNVVRTSALQLLEAYGSLDFVICQMLHSCIFAANRGIAFFNIAYDQKSVAFCELLGIPQCAVPHYEATADLLKERCDDLFGNREAIRNAIVVGSRPLKIAKCEFASQVSALVAGASA